MKKKVKITPEIVDYIKSLKSSGCSYSEINVVLDREYGFTRSSAQLSNIVNGNEHSGKGTFSDEDDKYIQALIDGDDVVAPRPDLDRFEKFGIRESVVRVGVKETVKHYTTTTEMKLSEDHVGEIVKEVDEWIDKNDCIGEDEIWFKSRILEQKKGD